jgi:hypothetical protein
MKRALLLAAAVGAFAAPATAQAVTWKGAVIAKNPKRHALVTTTRSGAVRTVRAPKAFRKARVGSLVAVRGAALPDGTYTGTVRPLGRAKHVRFRGTVVKRMGKFLVVSAGNSVFSVRMRGGSRASASDGGGLSPGDQILCDAKVRGGGLESDDGKVTKVGHSDELDLEGIYLSTDNGVLSLAVVHRGLVKVTIPDGLDVPALSPGDEVALRVKVEPDGSFSLISLENEDSGDDDNGDDGGIDDQQGEFTVTGILKELTATSVAVEVERHPDPVRCAVKNGVDLEGFNVGDLVEMTCKYKDGKFFLTSLKSDEAQIPDDGEPQYTVNGFISSIEDASVGVKVQGRDEPYTCKLQAGQDLRGFAVGDFVEMTCRWDADTQRYDLVELKSDNAAIPEDGQSWFTLEGVIVELYPGYKVGIQVAHHTEPVRCAMPQGMDLRGFAVGDAVEMQCHNDGSGFYIASISSANAVWPDGDGDQAWFTVDGILQSIGTDSVGVQVNRHPELVRCTFPVGTDLSGFAVGDVVEMHCHFHDGRFNLATLQSEHSFLKLED